MEVLNRQYVDLGDPKNLKIEVVDQKGPGGGNQRYDITNFDVSTNPSRFGEFGLEVQQLRLPVIFQNGIPGEKLCGVTMEALLAICEHRLEGFQSGNFPCEENAEALVHISAALDALHRRTKRFITQRDDGAAAKALDEYKG